MVVPRAAKHARAGITYDAPDVFEEDDFKYHTIYVEDFDIQIVHMTIDPGQTIVYSESGSYMGYELYSCYISSETVTPPENWEFTVRLVDNMIQLVASTTHTVAIPFVLYLAKKVD